MCDVCEEYYVYILFLFMCLFVGLNDFVKRGVLILVDEIPRYRNYLYYSYCYCELGSLHDTPLKYCRGGPSSYDLVVIKPLGW